MKIKLEQGMPLMHYTYTSNNVNQYTQMTVPAYIPVTGKASTDAKVTVVKGSDGSIIAPTRSGEYFSTTMTVDNSSSKVTENLTINAVKYDATQEKDIVATENRTATVNSTPQSFTYDPDGNMLTNGDWAYTWNGENRMIEAIKANDTKLEFKYDYMGRRVEKKVYTYSPSTSSFELSTHQKFVYDGYNQIAEFNGSDALQKSYLRDGDILIAVTDANLSEACYYMYDGNKNVVGLVDGSGNLKASYEYGPFGKTLVKSGDYASANTFRFSSEYHDDETGLVYYNYRYYIPTLGRWTKRDPIEEDGGNNLYVFVKNNAVSIIDINGLENCTVNLLWGHTNHVENTIEVFNKNKFKCSRMAGLGCYTDGNNSTNGFKIPNMKNSYFGVLGVINPYAEHGIDYVTNGGYNPGLTGKTEAEWAKSPAAKDKVCQAKGAVLALEEAWVSALRTADNFLKNNNTECMDNCCKDKRTVEIKVKFTCVSKTGENALNNKNLNSWLEAAIQGSSSIKACNKTRVTDYFVEGLKYVQGGKPRAFPRCGNTVTFKKNKRKMLKELAELNKKKK